MNPDGMVLSATRDLRRGAHQSYCFTTGHRSRSASSKDRPRHKSGRVGEQSQTVSLTAPTLPGRIDSVSKVRSRQ